MMPRKFDHAEHLPAGWRALFARLLADLEAIDATVQVIQAKQKHGAMRVYIEDGTPAMFELLRAAEQASLVICEECGGQAWLRKSWRGVWRTLCDDHAGEFARIVALSWSEIASQALPGDDDAQIGDENDEIIALQEQRRNAARFKTKIIVEAGGVLDVEAVRALLELPSAAAVHKAVRQRKLLAIEDSGRLWFPSCQFSGGQVLPGIQAILNAAPATHAWRILQYLLGRDDGLAGHRPIDLIMGSAEDTERAVRFARVLES